MAQTYPLDSVIRKVAAGTRPSSSAQRVIRIDARQKKAIEKKPLLGFGDLRYYLVSNNSDGRHVAHGELSGFQLKDLENTIGVSIVYQVGCAPGNEALVAQSLFDLASPPSEMLDRHLERWLIDCGRDGLREFINSYFDDRTRLLARLRSRALDETGLDLQIRLSLDAEKSFNTLVVASDHLPVGVNDYHDVQDLKLKAELEVDEANRANAILHFPQNLELQRLVPQEVKRYIKQNVSMQTFYTELDKGPAKAGLTDYLNRVLKPAGRRIGALGLEPRPSGDLQPFFQDQMDVICGVHQYPNPILINNKVQMILKDIARYKGAKSPDLKTWLQEKLERFIPQLLFETRYIDLLVRFQPLEKEIKRALTAEAQAIGYEIRQLITVPDLEPIRWKDNFTIDAQGTFETRVSNVHVKLHIVVTARINRLDDIEPFLNRQQKVPKLMETSILNLTRQYLHKVEPERFYMRFNFVDADHPKELLSVEAELINAISKQLKKEFHAEVIDVIPKIVDTELITRFRQLQENISPFEVTILSLHGGEPVVFRGKFQVVAVDSKGWHQFQVIKCDIDGLRQNLEEHIRANLATYPHDALVYRDPRHREVIENKIQKLAREYVCREFGLTIQITSIHRDHTGLEMATNRQKLGRYEATLKLAAGYLDDEASADLDINKEKLAQLKKLLKQRTSLTGMEGAEEEIRELEETIGRARQDLATERLPSIEEVEETFLPRHARAASLKEFSRILSLPDSTAGSNNGKDGGRDGGKEGKDA